ncbi:MAG: hypothetical protein EBU90_22800 [Proteobacteria bacterium]|nr:hypothetical protein [Pseudomonadota bacterium]NBP15343.1 hypothetical protein [bacterium]
MIVLKQFITIPDNFLLKATFFLINGIFFADLLIHSKPLLHIILGCSFSLLILITYCIKKRSLHLAIFAFLLGYLSYSVHFYRLDAFVIPQKMTTAVQVTDITQTGNYNWPYRITGKALTDYPFSFFIFTKRNPPFNTGDTITCKDLVIKKSNNKAFRSYLYKQAIVGTAFQFQCKPETVIEKFSITGWLDFHKERIFNGLKKKMPSETFAFFSSLFMGDKSRVKQTIEKHKVPFQAWGISHHLARSGLHLVLFILAWHFLISLLPFHFTLKTLCMLLLCCVYYLLTPPSISFIRAFLLFLFYKFCNLFDLPVNAVHLICLVCCLILLYSPFQLFFLDFQLSFFLTFCLAWISYLDRKKRILNSF